jgi:hypothetical protein
MDRDGDVLEAESPRAGEDDVLPLRDLESDSGA